MANKKLAIVTLGALAMGFSLPATAAQFDSQKCKAFISGTWTSKPGTGDRTLKTTYDVGGTYQQGDENPTPSPVKKTGESGSWDAQPNAAANGCKLQLTPNGGKAINYEVSIVDNNTMKAEDGTVSKRLAGQMEPSGPP